VTKTRGATYSAARIGDRVRALGREISRAYEGRRLDVVVTMDRSFVFAADLIRAIDVPVVLHFLREDVRDVDLGGQARREVFFANRAAMTSGKERPELKGRDVLLVDAVIDSGITQDFLLRRIGGWRCSWTRLPGAAWPWSPITSASGLHQTYCGPGTAWLVPMARGETRNSWWLGRPPRDP
jgi:hypoxanthine-guanine phosphoribosyltransferase